MWNVASFRVSTIILQFLDKLEMADECNVCKSSFAGGCRKLTESCQGQEICLGREHYREKVQLQADRDAPGAPGTRVSDTRVITNAKCRRFAHAKN